MVGDEFGVGALTDVSVPVAVGPVVRGADHRRPGQRLDGQVLVR